MHPRLLTIAYLAIVPGLASTSLAQPFFTSSFVNDAGTFNQLYAQGFSAFVSPTPDPGLAPLDTVSLDRFQFFKSGNPDGEDFDVTESFRLAIVDNYFLDLNTLSTTSVNLVGLSTNAIDGTASISVGAPITFNFDNVDLTFAADYAAIYVTEGQGGELNPILIPSLTADFNDDETPGVFVPTSDYGDPDLDFQYSASNFINTNEFGSFFAAFTPAADAKFVASFNLPTLEGDFNDDGVVDASDYTVFRENEGLAVTLPNEVSTTGQVTTEDYTDWANNLGATLLPAGSAVAVPEPSCLAMLSALGVYAFAIRIKG